MVALSDNLVGILPPYHLGYLFDMATRPGPRYDLAGEPGQPGRLTGCWVADPGLCPHVGAGTLAARHRGPLHSAAGQIGFDLV